jgi:ABC-type sulfate transport system permease subunit
VLALLAVFTLVAKAAIEWKTARDHQQTQEQSGK